MELFCKTLRTRKFSMGKFFGASTHGILTHSGFRKCIWKVGTTNVWPCFGRPKLGECTKWGPLGKLWGVQKNKHGHNFQNIGSKLNQRGLIVYEPTSHNFANGPHFVALTQLRATKTGSNICCTHLSYTFAVAWYEYFWHWTLFFWKWKHSH